MTGKPKDSLDVYPGPIEVWLTQGNMEISCMIVLEDESTQPQDIRSLSMRGAQREITGWLIGLGWEPAGRWDVTETADHQDPVETVRLFRRPKPAEYVDVPFARKVAIDGVTG